MATESQILANRENAQLSSGPNTESGKAASSLNALTLGLYTRADYVRPEERDLYKEFCETMYSELNPEGLLEDSLAAEITGATWRLRRCSGAEADLGEFDESTDKTRRSIERARAHAHSILHRSINQLKRLQKETARNQVAAARDQKHAKQAEGQAFDELLASICNTPGPDLGSICKTAEPTEDKAPSAEAASVQIPRNAPCPCQSGKKYKNCCAQTGPGWPALNLSEAA
jgi:hypothetical protein